MIQKQSMVFLRSPKNLRSKKEKEELPDLTFIIEPWQIEKDTMTGIYVEIAYGRYETGIVKIPDFMLEKKKMADMKRILIIRILSIF